MLKSFCLTTIVCAASMLLIAEKAFSNPLPVSSPGSGVVSSDSNMPVCYIQTPDGRTFNLSSFCRARKNQPQPQVAINGLSYEKDRMIGNVVNNTGKTVRSARVNYEVLDQDGTSIKAVAEVDASTLSPGQSASFEASFGEGYQARVTSVEWD